MKKLILVVLALSLAGCASRRLKKNCESANWFQRGVNLAKKGKLPEADKYLKRCEAAGGYINHAELDRGFKLERDKQCDVKKAYRAGKEGIKPDFAICFSHNEEAIKREYNRGLKLFCSPSRAYKFGLAGKVYGNTCLPEWEESFNKKYTQGRKKYFKERITNLNKSLAEQKSKLAGLKKDQRKNRNSKRIKWDIASAEGEISSIEEDIVKSRDQLAKLESN